jgi:LCP family protein required for cell wall assembly
VLILVLSGCVSGPLAPTETPEVAPVETLLPTPSATPMALLATDTPGSLAAATRPRPQTPAAPPRTATPAVALIRPDGSNRPPALTTTLQPPQATPVWPPSPLDQTDNLLVMGVDYRAGDAGWRTDTIMVIALDAAANRVGIVSIPRDLYVEIPGYGLGRINQADFIGETTGYAGGGQALLRRVISDTLGIPTRHYVRIKMEGLVRLVDTLGGVTVVLDCPLYERTPNDSSPNGVLDWSLPAGAVLLDGESAKKFATYRYATTDFGRAQRQQQLIWAIRDRALQVDVLPRIPELWKAFADMFSTDLGLLDIGKLAGFGAALKPENVHGVVLGADVMDYYITPEGAWVLVIADHEGIAAKKAQLFAARPLATLNISDVEGGCPPAPTPPPTFTPTPAAGDAPAHTPTPESTPSAPPATPTPTATPS